MNNLIKRELIIKNKKSKNIFYLDFNKVIEKLKYENCSFIRFGDGEIKLIHKKRGIKFQKYNEKICELLKKALVHDDNKLLIGILNKDINFKYYYAGLINYLINNKIYFDALITRIADATIAKKFISIWDNKDVCVIHHSFNRHLKSTFKNAKSIKFIKCQKTHTFDIYDFLKDECLKIEKTRIIAAFCGPVATILCFELYLEGYQALDLGRFYKRYRNIKNF